MFSVADCSSANATRLIADLLQNYQKIVRPGTNYSNPTVVHFEFDLLSIREFVELTNKFAITGVFEFEWLDERLTWDPSAYGGIQKINIPQNMVWKPEMISIKPFSTMEGLGLNTFGVVYNYTGNALWIPGDNYDTPCEADVTYYPFDHQTCSFQFSAWTQIPTDIELTTTKDTLGLGLYSINPMWDITDTKIAKDKNEFGSYVHLDITFKRLYGFYVLNMIVPICLISFVNIFVFILPAESGERIGFSITVFLALSVLLTILSEHLPKASRPRISMICYLIFFQTTISIFVMLTTIISLRFFFTSDSDEVTRFWKKFEHVVHLNFSSGRTKRQIGNTSEGKRTKINGNGSLISEAEPRACVTNITEDIPLNNKTDVCSNDTKPENQGAKTSSEQITWRKVGLAFDKACVVLFILVNIVNVAVFMFIIIANGKI